MSAFAKTFRTELFVTHATWDRMSGRDKLLLQCPAAKAEEVLRELRLLKRNGDVREGVSATLTATEEAKTAYIRGAFLGGGSCTIPSEDSKSGYHLEFVFSDRKTARDFCDLLAYFELIARTPTWYISRARNRFPISCRWSGRRTPCGNSLRSWKSGTRRIEKTGRKTACRAMPTKRRSRR